MIRSSYRRAALLALSLACALALAGPVGAAAQVGQGSDPTADQYDPGIVPPKATTGGGSGGSAGTTVGGLPFTGAELGALGIAALVFVGGGVALRAYIRSEQAERG